jgi:uncharacterized membrane protein
LIPKICPFQIVSICAFKQCHLLTIIKQKNNKDDTMNNNKLKFVILSGLFSAIVFVATYAVRIPLPGLATGGLIHLGNIALFTIAIIFGERYGAISGAFGMALFDVLSPWVIWAPGTFIIRGLMGFLVGKIANGHSRKGQSLIFNLLAMIISGIWMIVGYFGYNLLLYGDWPAAVASIPGDMTQLAIGIIISLPLILSMNKSGVTKMLRERSN